MPHSGLSVSPTDWLSSIGTPRKQVIARSSRSIGLRSTPKMHSTKERISMSRSYSARHVLELREVERLRPFETALGEHLKHRSDARGVIQAAERDEDHSWEALQVAAEHPGAALRAEVSV